MVDFPAILPSFLGLNLILTLFNLFTLTLEYGSYEHENVVVG